MRYNNWLTHGIRIWVTNSHLHGLAVWMSQFLSEQVSGLVLDEWFSQESHPFGNEYHTVCCAKSGILYSLKIVKAKDRPRDSGPLKFNNEGKTTGLLKCLMHLIWNTGHFVILDSEFCVLLWNSVMVSIGWLLSRREDTGQSILIGMILTCILLVRQWMNVMHWRGVLMEWIVMSLAWNSLIMSWK